jgi:hypothetical protein
VIWGLFALTLTVWLAAIFYIVKGWGGSADAELREVAIEGVDKVKPQPEVTLRSAEIPAPTEETEIEEEIETDQEVEIEEEITAPKEDLEIPISEPLPKKEPVEKPPPEKEKREPVKEPIPEKEKPEIPVSEPPPKKEEKPLTPTDIEDFYQKFGRGNIVEFPAEYIDREKIRGLKGDEISIIEFAKNCYREIGFKCLDSTMIRKADGKVYKINIFDLISHHYTSTDDEFIAFFGDLREELEQDIQSIDSHPQMTLRNKRALIGRYEGMPQLLVWNDRELFLVLIKSKDEILNKGEIDFFKEYILEKGLFRAKIFKVIEKLEARPMETKAVVEEKRQAEAKPVPKKEEPSVIELPGPQKRPLEIKEGIPPAVPKAPKKVKRKSFTKGEVQFLMENRDKMTNEELASHLGRSLDSVTHKLSRLNLGRESYEWTDEKDDFLRVNLTKLTYRELAERLGTTIPSVRARCKKLGIKK